MFSDGKDISSQTGPHVSCHARRPHISSRTLANDDPALVLKLPTHREQALEVVDFVGRHASSVLEAQLEVALSTDWRERSPCVLSARRSDDHKLSNLAQLVQHLPLALSAESNEQVAQLIGLAAENARLFDEPLGRAWHLE